MNTKNMSIYILPIDPSSITKNIRESSHKDAGPDDNKIFSYSHFDIPVPCTSCGTMHTLLEFSQEYDDDEFYYNENGRLITHYNLCPTCGRLDTRPKTELQFMSDMEIVELLKESKL